MLADIGITEDQVVEISEAQNIVVDLNGHTIDVNGNEPLFTVNGTLEITDEKDGSGVIKNVANGMQNVVSVKGNFTLSNGTLEDQVYATGLTQEEINAGKTSSINFKGGTVNSVINNVNATQYCKYVTFNITDNAYVKNIDIYGWSVYKINGENVRIDNFTNRSNSAYSAIIKDKVINKVLNKNGRLIVKGGTIGTIEYQGDGNGNTNISNNSIIGRIYDNHYNTSTSSAGKSTTIINNSIVLSQIDLNSGSRLYVQENTIINPPDSVLTNNERTTLTGFNQSDIGIKRGIVYLGEKDYNMNKDLCKVYGTTNAIDQAQINFYDGTIYGDSIALGRYAALADVETYYQATTENEDKIMYLKPIGTVEDAAGIDDSGTYETLNAALQTVYNTTSKTATIDLINKDTVVSSADERIVIKSGMNITLRLNGFAITGALSGNAVLEVEAGATLTIIDTLGGKVENTAGLAIDNKGTLNIGKSDDIVNAEAFSIKGETNAIINTGTLKFNNGMLQAKQTVLSGSITPRSGYTITDGTINIENVTYNTKYLVEQ